MARKPASPKPLRRWRIILIRHKGERLGTVEATDADAAIKIAIEQFGVTEAHRSRLIAQPLE